MKTILLTGAAGVVGSILRPFLRERYRLRLTDARLVQGLIQGEEYVPANLVDLEGLTNAANGAEAVIHLGAVPKEEGWDAILPANIVGTYNMFEAARRAGVKRFIYASSNHAVGFYRRTEKISVEDPVRPDGRYGLSKVFGEAVGRLYADKYGLEVFCIRLGAVTHAPLDVRRLAIWISPRDLAQLVEVGLTLENLSYEIVFGMSDNARAWWDNANAHRLGYRPQDRSEDFAAETIRREPAHSTDDRAQIFHGGPYVTAEFIGDPASPTGS